MQITRGILATMLRNFTHNAIDKKVIVHFWFMADDGFIIGGQPNDGYTIRSGDAWNCSAITFLTHPPIPQGAEGIIIWLDSMPDAPMYHHKVWADLIKD